MTLAQLTSEDREEFPIELCVEDEYMAANHMAELCEAYSGVIATIVPKDGGYAVIIDIPREAG